MKYDSKISTLEEQDDLYLMTMDQLHGILTAHEMRTGQNNTSKLRSSLQSDQENKKSKA